MDKFQKIGVTAFIRKHGKVLIMRRSARDNFLPGCYELPGGKVEFGEEVDEALRREVKEETGLTSNPIKPYSTFSYISGDGNKHTVDIQFIVEIEGQSEIKLSDEHDDFAFISKDELENYKISDLMKESILKGFDQK